MEKIIISGNIKKVTSILSFLSLWLHGKTIAQTSEEELEKALKSYEVFKQ